MKQAITEYTLIQRLAIQTGRYPPTSPKSKTTAQKGTKDADKKIMLKQASECEVVDDKH
jgi:hypothetical protein